MDTNATKTMSTLREEEGGGREKNTESRIAAKREEVRGSFLQLFLLPPMRHSLVPPRESQS